ncbi:CbiQ family ECF transporter T component [Vitiosangium sp. GDMCC 1.1324]|uniref:CbiQ family ECF transporter T component n=1 Tax=Vitiosangium sp. (strain GDMCC 1.1324) TaxID=2138576 RepID=UPI00130E5C15|nr:CbiQ family ECF transporter T component [Vitiosangium sp. GDMCC 1.1324]
MSRASLLRERVVGLDARLKLGSALLALLVALAGPAPQTALGVAGLALLVSLAVGERGGVLLRRLGVAAFSGVAVWALHWLLQPEAGGAWVPGLVLGARVAAGATVFGLLTSLTPPWALVGALRAWRVPAPLAEVLALAVRYATVLERSARCAREAQVLRLGYRGVRRGLHSLGALGGLTLVRAFDQAHATAEAMAARGCRGTLLPRSGEHP